jgi:hypothetical protein
MKSGFTFAKSAGPNVRQRAHLLPFVAQKPEQPLRSQPAIVRVRKHRGQRRFERFRVGHGVQVDGRLSHDAARALEHVHAPRIRERDRQHRDAGGGPHRDRRQVDAIGPVARAPRVSFDAGCVGYGHG